MSNLRIGHGYDVHRFADGRKLIIGGIDIPHTRGLDGHSDADVLVHAIMDALLGAACERDIGKHFPDSDDSYKNISSLLLAEKVGQLLSTKGYSVVNIDATVIAEEPKLSRYIPEMISNISKIFKTDSINIKATTEEGLGFTGARDGIAAHAVCLIEKPN